MMSSMQDRALFNPQSSSSKVKAPPKPARDITSTAWDAYVNKMFQQHQSAIKTKVQKQQSDIVNKILLQANYEETKSLVHEIETPLMMSPLLPSRTEKTYSAYTPAAKRPGEILTVNTKRVSEKMEALSDLDTSSISVKKLMHAEKSKAQVLDKLARKYSPAHQRPGEEHLNHKSKFASPVALGKYPPERSGAANSELNVRRAQLTGAKRSDFTIVLAGQIRRGTVGNQTQQKKLLHKFERPPSAKDSLGAKSDKGSFLSSYHQQKTQVTRTAAGKFPQRGRDNPYKQSKMPVKYSQTVIEASETLPFNDKSGVLYDNGRSSLSPSKPFFNTEQYQEFSTVKDFSMMYQRQATPTSTITTSDEKPTTQLFQQERESIYSCDRTMHVDETLPSDLRSFPTKYLEENDTHQDTYQDTAQSQTDRAKQDQLAKSPVNDGKGAFYFKSLNESVSSVKTSQLKMGKSQSTIHQFTQKKTRAEAIQVAQKFVQEVKAQPQEKPVSQIKMARQDVQTPIEVSNNLQDYKQSVLCFLLREEELLYSIADLATEGQFQRIKISHLPYVCEQLYSNAFERTQLAKQRPRVFAAQLNIQVFLVMSLLETLVNHATLMRKYACMLAQTLFLTHQTLLLMIDLILQSCNGGQFERNEEVILLRCTLDKNLAKQKLNSVTAFRQYNEQNRANLRKIANELLELKGKEAYAFNDYGQQFLDILRLSIDEANMDISKNPHANDWVLDSFSKIQLKTSQTVQRLSQTVVKTLERTNSTKQIDRRTKSTFRNKQHSFDKQHSFNPFPTEKLEQIINSKGLVDRHLQQPLTATQLSQRNAVRSNKFDFLPEDLELSEVDYEESIPRIEDIPKFTQTQRNKLETVEEQSNCESPQHADFKEFFSPTLHECSSDEKIEGFEQARSYKLGSRKDATQLNYFKEMVGEAKQKKMKEAAAFSVRKSSIQQKERNSSAKKSDKMAQMNDSPTPKHNPTMDSKFSMPSDGNFMLQENIAFLIANAVHNHNRMDNKPVEVIANINNNFNIYGQIKVTTPAPQPSTNELQSKKSPSKSVITSKPSQFQLSKDSKSNYVKSVLSTTSPAKTGIGSGIKNIKKNFVDARESLKPKLQSKTLKPSECVPDTISLSSDQSELRKNNYDSLNNSILSGKLSIKSPTSPTKVPGKIKQKGGDKPSLRVTTPAKIPRLSNNTETEVDEPILYSPRAHKIPLKPELVQTEGPLTKSSNQNLEKTSLREFEMWERRTKEEDNPFNVVSPQSPHLQVQHKNSDFGSHLTKIQEAPHNVEIESFSQILIPKQAPVEPKNLQRASQASEEPIQIKLDMQTPQVANQIESPKEYPTTMLQKMFNRQKKYQRTTSTLLLDQQSEDIKREMLRQHQQDYMNRRQSKVSMQGQQKGAMTQIQKPRIRVQTAMSMMLSPQTKNFNDQENISLRIADSESFFEQSERDLDELYYKNAEKRILESLQLKRSLTIAEKIKAESPQEPTELRLSNQNSLNSMQMSPMGDTPILLDRQSSVRPAPIAELYPQHNFEMLAKQFDNGREQLTLVSQQSDTSIKPYNARKSQETTYKQAKSATSAQQEPEIIENGQLSNRSAQTFKSHKLGQDTVQPREELRKMASLISLSPFPQPIAEEPHETYEDVAVLMDSNAPFKLLAESDQMSPLHLATQENKRISEDRDSSRGKKETQEVELTDEQLIELEVARLRKGVTVPFLPPISQELVDDGILVYTLVLDLDETLIHCDEEEPDSFYARPGVTQFLQELAFYYEIVVFTAAMPDYADRILDNLDPDGRMIMHRLYRQHTTPKEDIAIKDLKLLGRPLERTIIIDNLRENFQETTPNNGIWVESWYNDMDDRVLPRLQPFLVQIAENEVEDVRTLLTDQIKENIIYACLERNKPIPPITELLK